MVHGERTQSTRSRHFLAALRPKVSTNAEITICTEPPRLDSSILRRLKGLHPNHRRRSPATSDRGLTQCAFNLQIRRGLRRYHEF